MLVSFWNIWQRVVVWEKETCGIMTCGTNNYNIKYIFSPNIIFCGLLGSKCLLTKINLVGKLDCCVQGQGHSEGSKFQWMFVQMMSSEPFNLLLPNLINWGIIMSWFAVFKVKVTVKVYIIKIWLCCFSWTTDSFAATLSLMVYHHKLECLVKRLDCWSRSRSQQRFRVSVFVQMVS